MAIAGISKRKLAGMIGVKYNTLLMKFKRTSPFTLDEAIKIKAAINATESIETLFDNRA